jgi:DNA invertase Pin-like site-specific DNA recombinase
LTNEEILPIIQKDALMSLVRWSQSHGQKLKPIECESQFQPLAEPSPSSKKPSDQLGSRTGSAPIDETNPIERGAVMNAVLPNRTINQLDHSGKIKAQHLNRKAIIYIRQSTLQQVQRHQESTRLQYGLADKAVLLGWPRCDIEVIDDDLGCSGSTMAGRQGFQRLVAEVGLDHVGLVLGLEMSRLSRSSRDWYQLLEVCAIFSTLIGDMDGIYDPSLYNDRLLLGLKGTMSEAELHILKQRMLEGKRAKARRGELGMPVAMGFVRQLSGIIIKDPDEQAQSAIGRVFELFERKRTINGVLLELVSQQIQMPHRMASGLNKGDLVWRRPNRVTLSNLLHNPIYAGAYA